MANALWGEIVFEAAKVRFGARQFDELMMSFE